MKLKIFTIGKLSLKPVGALVEEYAKRLQHYFPTELYSFKSVEKAFEKCHLSPFLILLDEKGKNFTSVQFSKWLHEKELHATKSLTFLIGPGEGLSTEIKARANFCLSLSTLTLQHELALVLLMEQLYRACTLLHNVPYHK